MEYKLNAIKLKSDLIKTPTKTKSYPDGNGLVLYHFPNGSKIWRYRYRYLGKANMISIQPQDSSYPAVSLAEAREIHKDLQKLLAKGIDPSTNRKEENLRKVLLQENSFQSVAKKWHEAWSFGKTTKHSKEVWNRLEADIFPELGSKPITEITPPQITMTVKKIESRGAIELAKRSFQTCGQIFRFAIAHGLCVNNPAKDLKPIDFLKQREVVNYARIDAKDLPELLRKIDSYTEQNGRELTRLALQLMVHTFVRTKELIGAKWSEFDFDAKEWKIPAERMKKKRIHIVPLSIQSIEILNQLNEISGGRDFVFPHDSNPFKCMSNNTILFALYRMGYRGRMTGHGFRGIASTILHEQGFNHDHIEMEVAHSKGNKVSASYDHSKYLEPRRKMMQHWSDYLDGIKAGATVINLRQA